MQGVALVSLNVWFRRSGTSCLRAQVARNRGSKEGFRILSRTSDEPSVHPLSKNALHRYWESNTPDVYTVEGVPCNKNGGLTCTGVDPKPCATHSGGRVTSEHEPDDSGGDYLDKLVSKSNKSKIGP